MIILNFIWGCDEDSDIPEQHPHEVQQVGSRGYNMCQMCHIMIHELNLDLAVLHVDIVYEVHLVPLHKIIENVKICYK